MGRLGADGMVAEPVLCHHGFPTTVPCAQGRRLPGADVFMALSSLTKYERSFQLRYILGRNEKVV